MVNNDENEYINTLYSVLSSWIIEKIDKYCEQSCSFSNCCLGSSCILYKIKNR